MFLSAIELSFDDETAFFEKIPKQWHIPRFRCRIITIIDARKAFISVKFFSSN